MFRAAKNEHWRNMYMSELNLKLVYNAMDNVTASRIAQELDGRGIPCMVKDAADAEFMNIIAGSSQFCRQFMSMNSIWVRPKRSSLRSSEIDR